MGAGTSLFQQKGTKHALERQLQGQVNRIWTSAPPPRKLLDRMRASASRNWLLAAVALVVALLAEAHLNDSPAAARSLVLITAGVALSGIPKVRMQPRP